MNRETPHIIGAAALASTLGDWPSFENAEIIRVLLHRDGHSSITIRLVEARGVGVAVTFTFEQILHLNLDGDVNRQNVISGLFVEFVGSAIKVTFGRCDGLSGHIVAQRVGVRVAEDREM